MIIDGREGLRIASSVPGLVALIFTAIGIYFGLRWTRAKEVVVIREVRMDGPFVLNAAKLKEVGLTAPEHEILALIAPGLSNREIGENSSSPRIR
jgi:hypothetical protein